jgi:hypothetical protein
MISLIVLSFIFGCFQSIVHYFYFKKRYNHRYNIQISFYIITIVYFVIYFTRTGEPITTFRRYIWFIITLILIKISGDLINGISKYHQNLTSKET